MLTYDALESFDGSGPCWDLVVPAWEVAQLCRTGFIDLGDEPPDDGAVDALVDQLVAGACVLGQIPLNYRSDDPRTNVEYDRRRKSLTVSGVGHALGGSDRLAAVVRADDAAVAGASFDRGRRCSLRVHRVPSDEEGLLTGGERAPSPSREPADAPARLARALVARSPYLGSANVATARERLSARDPQLVTLSTLEAACRAAWDGVPLDDAATFEQVAQYLEAFWDRLVGLRPELRPMPSAERRRTRAESLATTAGAIHAYLAVARDLWQRPHGLDALDVLADGAFFARDNEEWVRRGVVLGQRGERSGVTVNPAPQARAAFVDALRARVAQRAEVVDGRARTKAEAVEMIAALVGRPAPAMSRGSTEPKAVFQMVAERFRLPVDLMSPKPVMARAIVAAADLEWEPTYDSSASPSGGGGTVTLAGLNAVLAAARELLHAEKEEVTT